MVSFITLLIVFSLVYISKSGEVYRINSGNEYYLEPEQNYDWCQANRECFKRNMLLVSLVDEFKQQEMKELFNYSAISITRIWTSGNDFAKPETYQWYPTDESFSYTNWGKTEPDDIREHCTAIKTDSLLWFDSFCDRKLGFVCEQVNQTIAKFTNSDDMVKNFNDMMDEDCENIKIVNKSNYEDTKTSDIEELKQELDKKSLSEHNENFTRKILDYSEKMAKNYEEHYQQQQLMVNNQLELLAVSVNNTIYSMKTEQDTLKRLYEESMEKIENQFNSLNKSIEMENKMQQNLSESIKLEVNRMDLLVNSLNKSHQINHDHILEQFKKKMLFIQNDNKKILKYIRGEELKKSMAEKDKKVEDMENVSQNGKALTTTDGKTKFQNYYIHLYG
ncbi:uncharacterized protein LOC142225250 [Haematobia irritans]|uniref:uncharacterized protein LOC142225250 n=1 Tax=Haematobia irritans TaxID=7368 RepID=UPI003F506DCF